MVASFGVLLVYLDDLLHLVIAAHEYARAIMDMLGNNGDHAFHMAVDCLAPSCDHVS